MTQTPQSSPAPDTTGRGPEGEAPAPAFKPYLPSEEPEKHSHLPWIIMGLALAVMIGGILFWPSGPDEADADNASLEVGKMTPAQLAKDASMASAVELLRRMHEGTAPEKAACSEAMNRHRSPRLTRNLAMSRALTAQKRANEMRVRMERDTRMAERGY